MQSDISSQLADSGVPRFDWIISYFSQMGFGGKSPSVENLKEKLHEEAVKAVEEMSVEQLMEELRRKHDGRQ